MKVYHEIHPNLLDTALKNGLVRTSRSEKGDDQTIRQTDHFLDKHCPQRLKEQDVSRDNNLYAYACIDNAVIDITDGSRVPLDRFTASSKQQVLEIEIDPKRCFVSDLDAYDRLKSALTEQGDEHSLNQLATKYWHAVVRLQNFNPATVRRPEIMITYDIPPQKIRIA